MTLSHSLRACAAFGLLALASPVFAHDYKAGALKIDHPWTRATPGGAKVGGGFMTITNTAPSRIVLSAAPPTSRRSSRFTR